MPRPPQTPPEIEAIPGAVYGPARSAHPAARVVPLHVGDTWLSPFEGGRMQDLLQAEHPEIHRYSETRGIADLVEALVEKLRRRNGLSVGPESVLVTAGATAGLAHVVGALASPGEEILVLAPFWPLIRGMIQAYKARPVEVPFYDRVDSPEAAVEAVRDRIGERTIALYLCTPSNPTGRVLPAAWLQALAELARERNLWLISDEVYEDLIYGGEHVSVARFAPERTFSAFSFSKAYGMAGYRTGYLAGPERALPAVHKVATQTSYSAPTAGQIAGLCALREGAEWLAAARACYREAGEGAAEALGLERPEGSTFLFFDVAERLDERGVPGFLADCLEEGVALSPGSSCGSDYGSWVRLSFTSAPPADVAHAARLLAKRLG